jgi:sortase A
MALLRLERVLLVLGLILTGVSAAARIQGQISANLAIQDFEAAPRESAQTVDVSLWSAQRVRQYNESLAEKTDLPLAVLRIPKLNLEVPVFDGTDEWTLNRGAGRIIGTARLGDVGNIGIAGHRDGFFRGLKDIALGDVVELTTPRGTERYVVTQTQITTPEDVSVLQPTATSSLTLVTCYPFYFVGSAPQRYIVHASIGRAETSD